MKTTVSKPKVKITSKAGESTAKANKPVKTAKTALKPKKAPPVTAKKPVKANNEVAKESPAFTPNPKQLRDRRFTMLLTDDEFKHLEKIAMAKYYTPSEYIRRRIFLNEPA